MQKWKCNIIDGLYVLLCLINLPIKLTLFSYLKHKYNLIEDIALKIAIKMLVIFLYFLSTLYSLYIYQRNKDVIKMNSFYIASNEHSWKFLVGRRRRESKKKSILLINGQINIAASY